MAGFLASGVPVPNGAKVTVLCQVLDAASGAFDFLE